MQLTFCSASLDIDILAIWWAGPSGNEAVLKFKTQRLEGGSSENWEL